MFRTELGIGGNIWFSIARLKEFQRIGYGCVRLWAHCWGFRHHFHRMRDAWL